MPHIRSLTTEDIWRATAAERAALADLLAGLTEEQWDHQSLCAQWRVRDVVAHVVQTTRAHLGWILVNLARGGGGPRRGRGGGGGGGGARRGAPGGEGAGAGRGRILE
ncbi:maleylpyruvate isomerase family mycothiol-dependent enzyme [Nocardia brasiliensis]|uniref:maleylpyruvate isomerase family mycothiol-dependent enzyme n=1 Tax=Nocardia brasiliensis TaxID=37326 RepID=UPI0024565E7E|nr:maleylpyruvate isomerase N-terminal domain-containing protein [Nocardia brasiliensis]